MGAFFTHLDPTGMVFVLGMFALFSTFLSGVCLLLCIRNSSLHKKLWREVNVLNQRIDHLESSAQGVQPSTRKSMDKTEFKSRLERHTDLEPQVPEKFRHVTQLERSGLGVREIAEVLDVSRQEAEQMLSLSRAVRESSVHKPD